MARHCTRSEAAVISQIKITPKERLTYQDVAKLKVNQEVLMVLGTGKIQVLITKRDLKKITIDL